MKTPLLLKFLSLCAFRMTNNHSEDHLDAGMREISILKIAKCWYMYLNIRFDTGTGIEGKILEISVPYRYRNAKLWYWSVPNRYRFRYQYRFGTNTEFAYPYLDGFLCPPTSANIIMIVQDVS